MFFCLGCPGPKKGTDAKAAAGLLRANGAAPSLSGPPTPSLQHTHMALHIIIVLHIMAPCRLHCAKYLIHCRLPYVVRRGVSGSTAAAGGVRYGSGVGARGVGESPMRSVAGAGVGDGGVRGSQQAVDRLAGDFSRLTAPSGGAAGSGGGAGGLAARQGANAALPYVLANGRVKLR